MEVRHFKKDLGIVEEPSTILWKPDLSGGKYEE
jgi:hypothetical protein